MELKTAGILLILAGWILMIMSLALLLPGSMQTSFATAGFGVELLGMFLLARSYRPKRKKRNG